MYLKTDSNYDKIIVYVKIDSYQYLIDKVEEIY